MSEEQSPARTAADAAEPACEMLEFRPGAVPRHLKRIVRLLREITSRADRRIIKQLIRAE